MKVAIVGASGAVGQEFLRVLEQREFPIRELLLFGSERSAGRTYKFRGDLRYHQGHLVIQARNADDR